MQMEDKPGRKVCDVYEDAHAGVCDAKVCTHGSVPHGYTHGSVPHGHTHGSVPHGRTHGFVPHDHTQESARLVTLMDFCCMDTNKYAISLLV